MTEWKIPDYEAYYPIRAGIVRPLNETYQLHAQLDWPLELRQNELIALLVVAVWVCWGIVVVLMSGRDYRWSPQVIVVGYAALAAIMSGVLGALALGWWRVQRTAERYRLAGPQLWLPQARLSAGEKLTVRFQSTLGEGRQLPTDERLEARLLCLEVLMGAGTEMNSYDFLQRVVHHMDLPPRDVDQETGEVQVQWTFDLPQDARTSRLKSWPRIIWMVQVRLVPPALTEEDITFMLPVEASDRAATPPAGTPDQRYRRGSRSTGIELGGHRRHERTLL